MAEFLWQSQTDSVWDLSPLRVALLIFYKLFHVSLLNMQNFPTEVSVSFVQRNARVALSGHRTMRENFFYLFH